MTHPPYGTSELFQAFLRSAQYIVRLKAQQDVWEHLGQLVVTYFPAEWVAFGHRDAGNRISIQHCTASGGVAPEGILTEEVQTLVADVLESGFITSRVLSAPAPSMTALLPILEEYQPKAVMLIGHRSADPLPRELLNTYLAIASLAGSAFERLHSELELNRHRAALEELVKERTADLARAKRQNELLLHSVSEGLCGLDLEGNITFVNPFAAQTLGWDAAELIGRSAHCTFHNLRSSGEPHPVEECLVHATLSDGLRRCVPDDEFLRRDGTWFPVEFATAPMLEEGRVAGAVLVFRDITERKQAQENLLKEKEFSEAAINSMPGIFYLFKEGGGLLRWNRNLEEVTGYSSEEVAVMQPLDFFNLPDRETMAAVIARVFREGKASAEADCLTKGGKRVPHYFTGFRTMIDDVPYLIGTAIDIADLKRAQDRLRDAQKLESLGVLAGGLAHDFNNLLVGVIGNASLVQDILPPGHPALEFAGRIVKTGEQAAHLTRQMLAYSGKGRFLVELLDLSDLVPEINELVQPSIPKKIAVRLNLTPGLPAIEADRGQMQQIVMNLILNASEAIGSHAGLITVTTGARELDDRYVRDHPESAGLYAGKYVYLEVRDTGCGMDEATRAKIFDPFFSTKFAGRGLGLAAVAGIVRSQKGAIEVTSEPGKGSCFTILVPGSERAVEVSPLVAGAAAPCSGGTILVVDDEEVVRELAKASLVRYGFNVLLADGGPAAIDVFKREPRRISLVLLDSSMPGMSGQEVLPLLRRIRPEVKVVVSSGYTESETMRIFLGQQVSGFIQKPYTSVRLAEKVRSAIG